MFVIEEMMIPYINIENPSTYRSENFRTKNDNKINLSVLTQKCYLICLLGKPKLRKSIFNAKVNFIKRSTNRNNLAKAQFAQL